MADAGWRDEPGGWLEPFLAALRHGKRRLWAPVYLEGLLGPGAVLVVDDTALPKQGRLSVGVARQYCGCLGKRANRRVLVSLTLARGEVPAPVSLGLFLPEAWARDPDRCARAGVLEEHRRALAKTDLALAEIDRVIAAGARFGRVVADAGYGISAAFRHALSGRGPVWAVGVPRVQNVHSTGIELRWPRAVTGRPRKHPVPSEAPVSAGVALASATWRRVTWRRGRKGPLAAEQLRGGWHLPGEEVWLVGERRASGEMKCYLANLPAETPLAELAATIKARRVCGQAHRQLKEELGLDRFEGRSWTGLHRHAALTAMTAFCFLQHLRLKGRGKSGAGPPGPPPQPTLPFVRRQLLARFRLALARCPVPRG